MLASALSSRSFVVTAELGPPRDPDPELVRAGARALAGSVDAVNLTDNQAATVKLSPVACSALLIDEGVDPILQITGRDRNVMALQSELLGAWALGVRTVLTLTGDPLKVGPYEGIATAVGDLDSLGLARLIATMNEGRLRPTSRRLRARPFHAVGDRRDLLECQTCSSQQHVGGATDVLDLVGEIHGCHLRAPSLPFLESLLTLPTITPTIQFTDLAGFFAPSSMLVGAYEGNRVW